MTTLEEFVDILVNKFISDDGPGGYNDDGVWEGQFSACWGTSLLKRFDKREEANAYVRQNLVPLLQELLGE